MLDTVWEYIALYSPLGAVGVWRWGVWGTKKIVAAFYRPPTGAFEAEVAVVTPVYNENPDIFRQALDSWRANGVAEIVAVIDYTDERCIQIFREFSNTFSGAKLIVTKTPGKRPALVDGIRAAASPFVALVDSDTVWGEGVRQSALIPFRDPAVGGVATRQSVMNPTTLAQRIFNLQFTVRYFEEIPFYVALGGEVVRCLSGRTAFYRKTAVLPLLPGLLNETFFGQPVISGDDKRLTYLLQAAGWKAAFQREASVYTPGMPSLLAFFRQRLRWARNSWRADLKVLGEAWIWRHPRLALYLIDNSLQPFAQVLSPTFFLISLYLEQWVPAIILLTWWHVSRVVRAWPHFRRYPGDLTLLPILIAYNFWSALTKIYALFTLYQQGWITRWDKSRLPQLQTLTKLPSYAAVGVLVLGMGMLVFRHEVRVVQEVIKPAQAQARLGIAQAYPSDETALERYEVQSGDTLARIAARLNVAGNDLVAVNSALMPSESAIWPGMVLSVPRQLTFVPRVYESDEEDVNHLNVTFDEATQTINVRGRGQVVRLYDIARRVGRQYLREVSPGEWYLAANLFIRAGVSLQVRAPEVAWLKLKSDATGEVGIRTTNGQIIVEGAKITSWDEAKGDVDRVVSDGRSWIAATHGSRLDLIGAEVAFLGDAERAAVTWTTPEDEAGQHLLTGTVERSVIHDTIGGAKVEGAVGMRWYDIVFRHNREK